MQARRVPEILGNYSGVMTSGSGGAPLKFSVNALARLAYNAALTRFAHWHGADTSAKLAQLRIFRQGDAPRYPDGRTSKGWSGADPDAPTFELDMRTPVDDQIDWLVRHPSPYLVTLPSNAMALAYAASPEIARQLDLKIIFSVSETIIPGAREFIAKRLGAKLIGIYSSEEAGFIATECPDLPHYHVCSEMHPVQLVDDAGLPVAPGQPGRVIVTTLYNYATPSFAMTSAMSQSRTPPPAAAAEPCRCCRRCSVEPAMRSFSGTGKGYGHGFGTPPPCRLSFHAGNFRWYRSISRKSNSADVADHGPVDLHGLRAYARENMHPSVEIELVAVDRIARGPGGKLDPFISQVSGADIEVHPR